MSIALSTLTTRLQKLIGDKNGIYIDDYADAINNAARELYDTLHKPLDDMTLIGNNILPPFIWNLDGDELDFYTEPSGTLAKTTTAGYYRHATGSAKVTASGADDAIVLDSNVFPRLLDLMDTTVTLKCWALPEDADDAFLDIVTTDADGSDTTESSTTSCPAGVFTLLEIEDYAVPDDITRIRVKLRVHTDTKYVYFDPPRLTGKTIYQYILPHDFQNGHLSQVWLQSSQNADDVCDDLHPRYGIEVFGWTTITDSDGYECLDFTNASPRPSSEQRMRLIGYCPLEDDLSSSTDTMTIQEKYIPRLLTYAAHWLYDALAGIPSSDDVSQYERASVKWLFRSENLKNKKMPKPVEQIHWRL